QGALSINECVSSLLTGSEFRDRLLGFEFIHQTGSRDFERIRGIYEKAGFSADSENPSVEVLEYVSDMQNKYAWADLIICRSGTGTLSELAAVGKPSILVPYPFAADNHQQKNAEALVKRGAARLILNKELSPEVLLR